MIIKIYKLIINLFDYNLFVYFLKKNLVISIIELIIVINIIYFSGKYKHRVVSDTHSIAILLKKIYANF
jgi:hypothetical protein